MIRELILNHLSKTLNCLLATDPLAFDELKQLAQKTLLIECQPLTTLIYLVITPYGIQLKNSHQGPVTVSLRGKPSALLRFAKSPDQTKMLMAEEVKIHGELDFLLKLKQIAAKMDLDLEGLLTESIGDSAANRLSTFAKGAWQQTKTRFESLAKSTTLYLQEESQLLPGQTEVEKFILDVNQFRQELDRIEARIQHVRRHA